MEAQPCRTDGSISPRLFIEIPLSSLKSAPQAEQPLFPAPAFYSQGQINVSHAYPYAPTQCRAAP